MSASVYVNMLDTTMALFWKCACSWICTCTYERIYECTDSLELRIKFARAVQCRVFIPDSQACSCQKRSLNFENLPFPDLENLFAVHSVYTDNEGYVDACRCLHTPNPSTAAAGDADTGNTTNTGEDGDGGGDGDVYVDDGVRFPWVVIPATLEDGFDYDLPLQLMKRG